MDIQREDSQDQLDLHTGAMAYQEGDYETAVACYTRSAEAGNIVALSNLGYCHYYGRSIPIDKEKAAECWQKASEGGDIAATYKLGDMYHYGDIQQDEDKAHGLYQKAFIMALDCADVYVYPDAILRMLRYYPDEIKKDYDLIKLTVHCLDGLQERIIQGDPYSNKLISETRAILKSLID